MIFKYHGRKESKWIDPDKYGYLDVISDIYSTVLSHLPNGRTITFSITCILPDGKEQIEVDSDNALINVFMLHDEVEEKINLNVHSLEVNEEPNSNYTINGYSHEVVGRDTNTSAQDCTLVIVLSTLESIVDPNESTSTRRLGKAPVRRKATICKASSRSQSVVFGNGTSSVRSTN